MSPTGGQDDAHLQGVAVRGAAGGAGRWGVLAAAAWAYYKVLSTPKETEYLGSPTPPLPENAEE